MDRLKILYCGYRDWAKNTYVYAKFNTPDEIEWDYISTQQELNDIDTSQYDLIFFVGWSNIISDDIVSKGNCICMHPSPLPKYRGGSPIQNQILNGETKSAVTFFIMNGKLDAGDILYQCTYSLEGDLTDVMHTISKQTIYGIQSIITEYQYKGKLEGTPQKEESATMYKRRKPEQSEITLEDLQNCTALEIHNKVRALQDPYPNAYIKLGNGEKLYLYKTKLQ